MDLHRLRLIFQKADHHPVGAALNRNEAVEPAQFLEQVAEGEHQSSLGAQQAVGVGQKPGNVVETFQMGKRVAHADDGFHTARLGMAGKAADIVAHRFDRPAAPALGEFVQQPLTGVDGDHPRKA